jgi:hypothetical protein
MATTDILILFISAMDRGLWVQKDNEQWINLWRYEEEEKRVFLLLFFYYLVFLFFFLVFALIVRISSNYLRLSTFIWVCNLSRIINYDQKEALIIHLVNILSWWCILSLRQRLATCYLGLQNLLYIKKKACKYGVKNARGEGTPFNRGSALWLFIPLEPPLGVLIWEAELAILENI